MKYRVQNFKKTKNGKSFSYPWIGYSYRNEKGVPSFKRLFSLNGFPDEAISAITAALSGKECGVEQPTVQFLQSVSIGAEMVAMIFAEKTGICSALNCLPPMDKKIALAMIIDRVTQALPHSKKSLFEGLPGSGLEKICGLDDEKIKIENMYYTLDHLLPFQDKIEKSLFKKHHPDKSRMFLYDITSTYFEGASCELEEYGYNRDHKDGKKQIVIGLIADDEGCPVSVEVFKGNTSDQSTVMARIDSLRKNFGIDEMVFVGDRGMLTRARRSDLSDVEYDKVKYVSALTHEEFGRFLEDDNHPLQLSLFDRENLVSVDNDGIRYVLSFNPELEKRNRDDRNRLLEKTEEHLRAVEKSVSEGRLKQIEKISSRLYRKINKWNCEKFFEYKIDEEHFSWSRNEKLIKSYEVTDGFYVFTSDVLDMSAEEIKGEYKKLQKVEQAFRTMKTADIFMRPIRLWNANRVRAHIFICMLSYMVVWYARKTFETLLKPEDELKMSLRYQWEQLQKIQIARIKIGENVTEHISQPTEEVKKILSLVGVSLAQIAKKYITM